MKKYKQESGFTIIEVTITGLLMVVLGAAILGLQYFLGKVQITSLNSYISVEESNSAVTTFIREVRTARAGDNGAYLIESGTDNSFVFFSDIDFDGESERVRYYLEGNILRKGVTEPTGFPPTYPSGSEKIKIITENVRNGALPLFLYFNSDWPEDVDNNPLFTPVDLSSVRLVRMYIRINPNEDDADHDYVLESYAQIRMVKDNL